MSFYAPIACQSARPINLLIARLALTLCTQGHSGWARDFERQARLILALLGASPDSVGATSHPICDLYPVLESGHRLQAEGRWS